MPVRVATSFRTSTGVETGHRSDMSIQSILLILSHDTNPYILYCIVLLLCTYLSIYVYIYTYHVISYHIILYHIIYVDYVDINTSEIPWVVATGRPAFELRPALEASEVEQC